MGSPIHFPQYLLGYLWFIVVLSAALFLSGVKLKADKVTESIIVAAVEGEVSSLNMIDDFKVTMGPSSVGRKISAKTILQTGKTGKVSLLFSNGTLVTVKPGSRFYLRKYKQLEAVVENLPKPGELEEEPTKSELSAHLDFGELIVKAPKLKKGSSMKLTSPIGVAGIRGTMFQFMAVRNSVSGDIMGGINLISGDIDFTDTGGKSVTLLSGQSIQLATSKLGEALASKTGELVDLSSTYGPALTEDGALPPPVESLMPSLSSEDDSSGDEESSEDELGSDDTIFTSGPGMSADFIQNLSSEIFFAIEENEIASSDFTFESIQMAPAVEVPVPEVQPPAPPATVTGETETGISLNQFVGPPPEIALLGNNGKTWWREISEDGFRMVLEMRSPTDFQKWLHLDPGIRSSDFLGNDFSENYIRVLNQVFSAFPAPVNSLDYPPFTLYLGQGDTLKETEVPFDETQTNIYELTYLVTDYRGFKSTITRTVETRVTRPTINNIPSLPAIPVPMNDRYGVFADWISSLVNTNTITDVAGENLPYDQNQSLEKGYFYLDPMPNLKPGFTQPQKATTSFQVVAVDWRGVEKRSDFLNVTVEAIGPTVTDSTGSTGAKEMTYELSATPLNQLNPDIIAIDEFGSLISEDDIVLSAVSPGQYSVDARLDSLDQLPEGQTYTFTYEITDSRGVMVEETRDVRIVANGPELSLIDFQSQNELHGIDPPHPANTIEYTDPWGELLPWLQSIGAVGLSDANFTSRITLNGEKYEDFTSSSPELVVGENVLSFTVIDPRYEPGETNSDWLDDLTDDNTVKTITVVKSSPKFVSLTEVPPIPMNDPAGDFAQWIADINITDVRGERLLLDRNQSSANGYFYLNQYPELYPGFTEPKEETTPFEIIAVDWRGESSTETSSINVVATGPTISAISNSSDLTFELSDTPLNQLDPDIIAVDEFGNSISTDNIVLHSISPGDYAVDTRLDSLDQLPEGQTYTFTYQITDIRGVMVEQERYVTIEATTPVWTVADFQSENELYPTNLSHPLNTIEYDDPWEELSPWLQEKVSAQDYNGSDLSKRITLELNGDNQPNFTNPQSTPNLEIGENDLVFKVIDPRFQSGTSETWSDDLTTTYSLAINAVVTPPTIDDYQDVIDTIPMDDLNNLFGNQLDQNGSVAEGWLSSVQARDVRGQLISYNQNKTNNGSGYFYLSPMPDLFTQGVYYFRIYARDWRDLGEPYETKSELLAVQVKATSPTIEGGEDYVKLEVELSSALINTIDPQITAQDEFNASIEFNGDTQGTIELVNVIGPNSETPEFRIDQLEEGSPYVLDYAVTDFRGVTANVKRYLEVVVTSPSIETSTIAFTSIYEHGTAKNSDWTIEYTDPAAEYSAWFNGVTAKVHNLETKELINYDYDGENFTKIIASSQIDEGYSSPANIESLFNFPGTHDLNFTIVDPRYQEGVTNQDWKDNLTFTSTFTFEVVATLPDIVQSSDLPPEVPMDYDPGRTFLTWLEGIEVTDVEGTGIDYDQTASTGARFYLDPMPNLDPGFTIPDAVSTEFDIVAIDTRGVERRVADLNVTVRAKGAEIEGSLDLTFELSKTAIKNLDPLITAVDQFGTAITDIVLTKISPGDYAVDARLDSLAQLPAGESYTFTYDINDTRGVMVQATRNVSIVVTAPELTIPVFQSLENLHPSGVRHVENSIEYKDPWNELPSWLSSITASDLNDASLTDSDSFTLKINGLDHADFNTTTPDLGEGANELTFEVIDPRYVDGTNTDWLDDLTTTDAITITVVKTLPDIVQSSDLPSIVPMEDPGGIFQSWIDAIEAKDMEGTVLSYLADESTRASSEDGYFYLDPLPNLDPGFPEPDENDTRFEIVAVDWRGVENRSDFINVTVKATGPIVTDSTGSTGAKEMTYELSATPLNQLNPDIIARDEFGTAITAIELTEVSGGYSPADRLDSLAQLPAGESYTLTYDINDTRGVMVQATRNVSIVVTRPELSVDDFRSEYDLYDSEEEGPHDVNTIEYKDPWNELPSWLSSISAALNDTNLTNLITLNGSTNFITNTPDLAEGANELTFEVIDPRYEVGTTHESWLDDLTTTDAITITVVKTPPVLEISYDTDRAGLSWDEDTSVISYLVKPNRTDYVNPSDNTDNGDDGKFAFTFHSSQQPRKPYYQATAFNGVDIPNDQFIITGVSDGLYNSLSSDPHHPITISVNDYAQRGTEEANGVTTTKNITLQIVDVLPPYMILKERDGKDGSVENDPIVIHGIVSHDNSVIYEFPDPGYQIVDNYYTEAEVQEHNSRIEANPDAITFEYPEAPNGISAESVTYGGPGGISFMKIPDALVFGDVSLSEANVTELSYEPVLDPSNNESPSSLTRWVRVVDNRIPEVHINGPAEISLNLYNILTGQENYFDYGAYASEDLEADGHVSWMESGWEDDWSVQLEEAEYNSSEFEPYSFEKFAFLTALAAAPSYASTVDSGELTYEDADARATVLENEPSIENLLALFTEIGPTLAVEIYGAELRFQLTYLLTDKAGNTGTTNAKRIVNFTNAESLVPIILINGSPPDPYEVEVGELEAEPGIVAYLEYSRSPEITPLETLFYLRDNQGQDTQTFPDWDEQKVNYHKASDGTEYYIDENGQWHTDDNATWRKFIVHYRAENPDFPNFSTTKELEIRIQDTTDPYFEVPENIDPQQAGIAFVDVGYSSLSDNYDDAPVVTKIIYEDNLDGTYDELTSPVGTADVFTDLANVGFWSPGTYQIEYTGIDDFNNTYNDDYSINVEDTIAPHIALVSESFLISPTAGLKAEHDTESNFVDVPNDGFHPYFDENSYSVSQWTDLFESIQSPDGWLDSSFDKTNPYVNYGDRTSYLKASEITNLALVKDGKSSSSEVQIDPFGRSFIWYSAFNLRFDDGSTLKDPGVLVVNPSDLEVTVDSEITITETNASDPNSQLLSLKFVYTAIQDGGISNEIESNYSKILYFLDEEKPLIILSPEDDGFGRTNASDKFFLIEAGVDLLADTRASEFKLWNDLPNLTPAVAVDGNTSYTLVVSAEDAVDGNLNSEIQRTIIDTDTNQTTAWGSNTIAGISHLNKIYRVEYDVRDGEDTEADEIRNWADTAERYFIVKDTIAPVIDPDRNGTVRTLSATDPDRDLSDINVVKAYMVNDLYQNYVSDEGDIDTDFSGINFDDNATLDWSVTIGKEPNPSTDNFDGAEVYPEQDFEDGGYYVKITVKDDSGNVSAPITRRLKIGDYRPPVIYLNGAAVIHDFFRYGTNTGFDDNVSAPRNQELLFVDQPDSPEFNSTGFGGGAHRLFLANYNFTDPGAYAEDADPDVNSSEDQGYFTTFDDFPDYDGNGVGEGHAIIRMDNTFSLDADDMEIGIIYARSSLESTSFQAIQNQMVLLSNDANLTNPSIVPKVEGNSSFDDNITTQESLNVWLYTIEYRVKDGWENLSDIKTRRVYFYESKQFADSAFYATPLYELNDIDSPYPDRNLSSLSDNQKDYDGDGVSDFWEKILGTKFNDATDTPNLSNPSTFSKELNVSIPN